MRQGLSTTTVLTLAVASALAAWATADSGAPPDRPCTTSHPVAPASAPNLPSPPYAKPPRLVPERIRWLAFGGGADPPSNQVSIEQNLALATDALRQR